MLKDPLAEASVNHMFERQMTAYRIAQFTVETNLNYHSSPDTTDSHAKTPNLQLQLTVQTRRACRSSFARGRRKF